MTEPPVYEDTAAGYPEAPVESPHTVSLDRLDVAVDDPGELSLSRGVPGVHPQPGAGVVDALHEQQGERPGEASRQDVLGELLFVGGVF